MYSATLLLHSWLRWVVILFGLIAIWRAIDGTRSRRAWLPGDDRFCKIFLGALDLQMLLGLLLYFVFSPLTKAALGDFAGAMQDPLMRFWAVEHVFGMIIGVALAHVGHVAGAGVRRPMRCGTGASRSSSSWRSSQSLRPFPGRAGSTPGRFSGGSSMRLVRAACAGLSLLAVVVLWPAMPDAQGGRAMAIDDLIGAVRVADPQLSPDGRTVAYVRTTTDLKSGRRNADLWVVPADGGTAKELVGGDKSENTPRWSRSGKQLAFISTRDGDPQVYLADADGSSVRKITELAKGVQPPLVFSADGTRIAFVSDVYPECAGRGLQQAAQGGD